MFGFGGGVKCKGMGTERVNDTFGDVRMWKYRRSPEGKSGPG